MRDKAESRRRWPRRSLWLATAEWRELGALGRIALIGVGISAIIALALGFVIPRVIEQHLIDERSATMATVTEALATRDLVPTNVSDVEQREQFDEAVRQNLLGGETVRVKVWSPTSDSATVARFGVMDEIVGLAVSILKLSAASC